MRFEVLTIVANNNATVFPTVTSYDVVGNNLMKEPAAYILGTKQSVFIPESVGSRFVYPKVSRFYQTIRRQIPDNVHCFKPILNVDESHGAEL